GRARYRACDVGRRGTAGSADPGAYRRLPARRPGAAPGQVALRAARRLALVDDRTRGCHAGRWDVRPGRWAVVRLAGVLGDVGDGEGWGNGVGDEIGGGGVPGPGPPHAALRRTQEAQSAPSHRGTGQRPAVPLVSSVTVAAATVRNRRPRNEDAVGLNGWV